jgi:hypothetical protein
LCIFDLRARGHKGISISADLDLVEGQVVTFVLRPPPKITREQHIPTPTHDQAQRLGVSFDRELNCGYESISLVLRPTRTIKRNFQPP